ncbi:Peroxide operon regulator [bioreactor metagenome]|uniref:Peroxide operon regulator n=1 Tax=bioreactor metagenome TaxID=1076179 RepID=A0A645C4H1_9ZZZZ|nr:transcriptional repressor [Rikenellaceae bacterium]
MSFKYTKEAFERLKSKNIKPSIQRVAIMDYLIMNRTHPSVDDVYKDLSSSMPTLSKTTVYNTLKLFSEKGAALMLTIDENRVNFDGDTSPHTHFLCKRCGKIYDLQIPTVVKEVIGMSVAGHQISEIHYYYKGVCKTCLEG